MKLGRVSIKLEATIFYTHNKIKRTHNLYWNYSQRLKIKNVGDIVLILNFQD